MYNILNIQLLVILFFGFTSSSFAAIALDRTRIVYPATERTISVNISNQNPKLPYLAQAWLENESGEKLNSDAPLMVLPPVQRIEPGSKGQIKIQGMPLSKQLPQDRESVFYFNLREIPPKPDNGNVLQIALQTRIKLFYRPAYLLSQASGQMNAPWQERLTLTKEGGYYTVNNPTPFHITIIGASDKKGSDSVKDFETMMVKPLSSAKINVKSISLGDSPVLTYVNDYGAQPELSFSCKKSNCNVEV